MKKTLVLRSGVAAVLLSAGVFAWSGQARKAAESEAVYADEAADFDPAAAVPGEVVVDFADDVSQRTVDEIGQKLGIRFTPESVWSAGSDHLYVGRLDAAREVEDLRALRADPRVEAAEEDLLLSIPEAALDPRDEGIRDQHDAARGPRFPDDPRYGEQWHMEQLHMPAAWGGAKGAGVTVAVIDTGVAHVEDLAQTEFVPGWNFVQNNDASDDDHGHGTHVAGTIAQSTDNGIGVAGVAYRARIMPLKVLSANGSGSVAGIADAIRYAADHGAQVINMSLGGRINSQVLAKAVKYAHDHGVTVVCAAGNDGSGKVSYPAANAGAIAVAATQKDEGTTFYSNWGKQVAVAAPGGNTRGDATGGVLQNTRMSGKDDYYFFMGTSMASPHVAGVAALIVSEGVTDPDAVKKILMDTTRAPAGMKDKPADYAQHYGAGIIDAAAAVKRAQLGQSEAELGFAGALCAAALLLLRRRGVAFGLSGLGGLLFGSAGLFFLPWLGLSLSFSGFLMKVLPTVLAIIGRGFPAWDQALLGAGGHGNPLFYSAFFPVAAALVLYGFPRLRGLLAGFSFGVAGHLLAQAVLGAVTIHYVPFGSAWLIGNALVAAALGAVIALR